MKGLDTMTQRGNRQELHYVEFGTGKNISVPMNGKTETKRFALNAIRDGHSEIKAYKVGDMGTMVLDEELSQEIENMHKKRIKRSPELMIALRVLSNFSGSLATIAMKTELSEEQKEELFRHMLALIPLMGLADNLFSHAFSNTVETASQEESIYPPETTFDPFLPEITSQEEQTGEITVSPETQEETGTGLMRRRNRH